MRALVELGEAKAAVDQIRRQVNTSRASPDSSPATILRLLCEYATLLESADALTEAEFVWSEALELVAANELRSLEAAHAFLGQGLLRVKTHDYNEAVAKLKEAVERAEELAAADELDRQILLAKAWRGQSQAFEALGLFSAASSALDALTSIKRQIRFIAFSPTRGR